MNTKSYFDRRPLDIQKEFGLTLRRLRKNLGYSQETLAEKADLHRTYVSDIERGQRNVSLQNIERLAQALNLSVADLFPQPRTTDTSKVSDPKFI